MEIISKSRWVWLQSHYHNVGGDTEGECLVDQGQTVGKKWGRKYIFLLHSVYSHFACPSRWANLYFLFLVILNWMPSMEVFHREITMLPLAIVLFVIMIKDGMEDLKRHRFDKAINCSNIRIYER